LPRQRKQDRSGLDIPRSRYHIEALARGLQVLGVFSEERPRLPIKTIAELTGLLPSTVFRIVMTLVDLGYLHQENNGTDYRLAVNSVSLGFSALVGLPYEELAMPALQRLQHETGESAFLSVLVGDSAVDVVSLRRPGLLSTVGQNYPLYCTPAGKVWLACMPPERYRAILDRMKMMPRGPRTLTSRKSLEEEIALVRRQGYSTVDEELVPGHCGAGAPILAADGACIAAVVATAATSRVSKKSLIDDIVPRVCRTADAIAQRVRWREVAPPLISR
jgi:IclR family pca regulon transcriptional regulator